MLEEFCMLEKCNLGCLLEISKIASVHRVQQVKKKTKKKTKKQ